MKIISYDLFKQNGTFLADWNQELEDTRIQQIKTLSNVYELTVNHSNGSCSCGCTPIIDEPRSCPTNRERALKLQDRYHFRGRPRLRSRR